MIPCAHCGTQTPRADLHSDDKCARCSSVRKCKGCGIYPEGAREFAGHFCPACISDPEIQKKHADASVAMRFNANKVRYDLIPHEWEEQLAKLLTAGALKYDDDNYKKSIGKPESAHFRKGCLASARRHLAAWQRGEMIDKELLEKSGYKIHHLTQASWNLLVLLLYDMREGRADV